MSRLFDDASSEYLEIDSAVVSGPPFTMAAWVYSDSIALDQTVLFIGDKDVANKFQFLYLAGTQAGDPVRLGSLEGGSPSYATTTTGFSANTWHHVAGVVAAADDRAAFIDGGSKGTESTSESPTDLDRTSIGRLGDSTPSFYFSGRVAEAAVWNVALTDAEVEILAEGYSPLFVRPQNIASYWPLIRDTDDDIVGGHSMTAFNTPTVATHPPVFYPTVQAYRMAAGAPPVGIASQRLLIGHGA